MNNYINKCRKCIFSINSISKKILLISVVTLLVFLGYLWKVSPIIRGNTVILQMSSSGLGNQLFQYSAAYAFAKKTNSNFYILLSKNFEKHNNKNSKDRYFELYKFGIKKEQIIYNTTLNQIYFKILILLNRMQILKVDQDNFFSSEFESKFKRVKKAYIIEDYFEAIEYFRNVENEIKELFDVSNLKTSRTEKLLEKVQKNNAVCIHLRLGDWAKTIGELDFSYYNEAIKLMSNKINNPKFYVFSDDIIEAKEKFIKYSNFQYIEDKTLLPIDDFFLLANCANTINSQSTFSWWSSFLNRNTKKTVIAPVRYIKNFHLLNDFNPQDWIIIKNTKINLVAVKMSK